MARQEPGEPYYRVDSPEAQTILDAEGDGAAIVDVRRNDEWVTGHAAGAIHIPIDDLLDRVDELPGRERSCFSSAPPVYAAAWPARWRLRWVSTLRRYITWTTARPPG